MFTITYLLSIFIYKLIKKFLLGQKTLNVICTMYISKIVTGDFIELKIHTSIRYTRSQTTVTDLKVR